MVALLNIEKADPFMLTRRALLAYSAAAAALFAATPWNALMAQPGGDPTGFVVQLGNTLAGIVNGNGSYEDKRRRLGPVIEQAVDVEEVARFALGRFWRTATPTQQQEFTQLFRAVLLNNIGSRLGQFQGVSFNTTTTSQRERDSLVGTTIQRPNQKPNNVQWVVSQASGQPRIIDVIAEGISLRLGQRDDYTAFLTRNNNDVNALLSAMRQRVAS